MRQPRNACFPVAVLLAALLLLLAAPWAAGQPAEAEETAQPVSRADGEYASTAWLVVTIALFIAWLFVANWVAADLRKLRIEFGLWAILVLGGGVVGFLLLLVIPNHWIVIGPLAAILCAGGSIAAYLSFRNTRVPPGQRITLQNLRNGLNKRSREKEDEIASEWTSKVVFMDGAGRHRKPQPDDEEQRLGYPLACRFLHDVVWRRASNVYILPAGEQSAIRVRVDGVLTERPPLPRLEGERIIVFLKAMAGLDVTNHRRPQSGRITIHTLEKTVELRIRTAGTTEGERLEARMLETGSIIRLGNLGLTEKMLANCTKMGQLRRGLIVVAGPGGSGVTTTLYALVKEHDAFQFNIHSLESPRLMDLDNVTQEDFDDQGAAGTFAKQFQSIVRKDPDIILLGGIPDTETAQLAMQTVKGGKKIVAGMQADDCIDALGRLVKLADGPEPVADSLVAILAQRLLRKLCPNCKEAYRPPAELLAKINLRADQFFRPTGKVLDDNSTPVDCPQCQGTGYVGRMGVYEMMVVTAPLRDLLRDGATTKQIKDECRRDGMLYLQENALAKVVEGVTSIKEVLRASQKRVRAAR